MEFQTEALPWRLVACSYGRVPSQYRPPPWLASIRKGRTLRLRVPALLAALLLPAALLPAAAGAAEVCRYEGTASHAGRIAVRTEVSSADGLVTVDATLALTASTWLFDVQYLMQETSTWRGNEVQGIAVNTRYSLNGRIKRQQWDVWARGPDGLEARRIQGKSLDDLARQHAGFAAHWPVAAFGQPWLQDWEHAAPDRRPDLDLRPAPHGVRPPLALAFYWSRWLPRAGGAAAVFLAGFKRDALASVAFGAPAAEGAAEVWRAPLRHAALGVRPASTVAAWVSPDAHLQQLAFDVHAPLGSGEGVVRASGCQGAAPFPSGLGGQRGPRPG